MSKKPVVKTPARNLPAVKKSSELTSIEEFDSGDNIPAGLENVTASDLIIPRLTILQDLSPQVKPKKAKYIQGAKPGMICDVGTQELFKEVILLPVFYAKLYLEWAPRGEGDSGPAFDHGTNATILKQCKVVEDNNGSKKRQLPNGNYIEETATYYLLNMSARGRRSFLPLKSTGLSASKRWMMSITNERVTRADGSEFQPPIYYRSWIATPVEEENKKGDYFGWKFSPGKTVLELDPTKHLLNEAKDFYAQAQLGLVRGDLTVDEDENTGRGEGSRM